MSGAFLLQGYIMQLEHQETLTNMFGIRVIATRELKDYEVWYMDKNGKEDRFLTKSFNKDEALVNLIKHLEQLNIHEVTK